MRKLDLLLISVLAGCVLLAFTGLQSIPSANQYPSDQRGYPSSQGYQNQQVGFKKTFAIQAPQAQMNADRSNNQPQQSYWNEVKRRLPDSVTLQTIFDFGLVVIGYLQWRVYARQAAILDKQTILIRQNYLLTHRPKLRVRNIVIKSSLFAPNQTVYGQFYVDNVGGTKAYVTKSHCEFLWNVAGLPMERTYDGKDANNPLAEGTIIVGSLAKTAWFDSGTPYPDYPPPGTDQANRAFFMGWIDYLDEAGLKRRTIFCREFLQRNGSARFWPVNDDPDYEYEQ